MWQTDSVPPEWGQEQQPRPRRRWEVIVERWAKNVALPFLSNGTVVASYWGRTVQSHIYPC